MNRFMLFWLVWTLMSNRNQGARAFCASTARPTKLRHSSASTHFAKPQRLSENVPGVVYVNDKCINCAACSNFAPETFARATKSNYHIVHQQPTTDDEIDKARAALAACPVAAIRLDSTFKQGQDESVKSNDAILLERMTIRNDKPFPRPLLGNVDDVYWVGHHHEGSFGCVPYLVRARDMNGEIVWIMVDTPKCSVSSIQAVTSLTGPRGPDYIFLTHVDDTADHEKWVEEVSGSKRIFHSNDLGRFNWKGDLSLEEVEVLLKPVKEANPAKELVGYTLSGEPLNEQEIVSWAKDDNAGGTAIVLHTPGHSPGSISLYLKPDGKRPGILFTGDCYAFTTRGGGHMTGFPAYGRDRPQQSEVLGQLLKLDWDVIAPGHGHARDYREILVNNNNNKASLIQEEMQVAKEELVKYGRVRF